MIGFVLAVAAGWLAQLAEGPLARPLARWLGPRIVVEEREMRALAFICVMLVAALLAEILDSGSPFWIILGGAVGLFGTRLLALVRKAVSDRVR